MNCLHSFKTKDKLKSHIRVCENKDFSNVVIPSEDTKIFEFNQYQKSHKTPLLIYANIKCLIEVTDGCKSNPENSSTAKVSVHIRSCFSMSTISLFKSIKKSAMYIEVKIAWKSVVNP